MSLDRRQLLRGSLAAGAAAVPLGALAAPAHGVEPVPRISQQQSAAFPLVLMDAYNNTVETYDTGEIDGRTNRFGAPKSSFLTGKGAEAWAPLECKFRKLKSGESVFMICGGDRKNGRVTIHRVSDSAPLGWASGLTNFPHSLEYLPTADVVVVVGTQGLDDKEETPPGKRSGGTYELYLAPNGGSGPLRKIPGSERPFRQAHGVVKDQNHDDRVWIFGGNKIVGYEVRGEGGLDTELVEFARLPEPRFENGHDLQPDPVDTQFLWATGSDYLFKINKAAGHPALDWWQPPGQAKSFSRHRSGRGIYTVDSKGNGYGSDKVDFLWPAQTVTVPLREGQTEKRIYKARLTDI